MKLPMMPKNLERVGENEDFSFACHAKLKCFTHCCRHLELSLTPYDVLRLKNALDISSSVFLDRYVIIEQEEEDVFPRCYLTMVDDGNVSCVFVSGSGCSVYPDRPGACRAYPLGRAAMRGKNNSMEEFYVLLNEDHCKGFEESPRQTPIEYCSRQGLDVYNKMNDALIHIVQHEKIRQGMRLTTEQVELYILALYNLDTFREKLFAGALEDATLDKDKKKGLLNDEELLLFGINWLEKKFFGTSGSV